MCVWTPAIPGRYGSAPSPPAIVSYYENGRGSGPPIVTLFIVPWLWAGTVSASGSDSARNRTSTIRCEVSTFPAATAAGGRGLTKLPSFAKTRRGRSAPAVRGASGSVRQRITYEVALSVTAH